MMSILGPRRKPFFRIGRYRRGVAAYVANRSQVPFIQCLDIVEWNWPILVDAYDAGERFQDAGRKILATMRLPVPPATNLPATNLPATNLRAIAAARPASPMV